MGKSVDKLIELVEEGEVDPWSIDVKEVTDEAMGSITSGGKQGLKETGDAILGVSRLIKFKSEAILDKDLPIDEEEPRKNDDEWDPAPLNPLWNDPPILNPPARRQVENKPSFNDLIDALHESERKCRLREEREEQSKTEESTSVDMVKGTPHEENIEKHIETVSEELEEVFSDNDQVKLQEFLGNRDKSGKVSTLLALLFMDKRGEVELENDIVNQA